MKILVDADACPVKKQIAKAAKQQALEIYYFLDTSHAERDPAANTILVGQGKDAVDLVLLEHLQVGDIVVTQDYGLAALVLAKKGFCIHPSGRIYSEENIDQMLFDRFLGQKSRKAKVKMKGPKKRTLADDEKFIENFKKLIKQNKNKDKNGKEDLNG